MRRLLFLLIITGFLGACGRKDVPDVSGITVDLQVHRFEQDVFKIDTMKFEQSTDDLAKKYPTFYTDFVYNILALPMQNAYPEVFRRQLISFIQSYQPVKDSADHVFANFEEVHQQVQQSLKYVKYYFPQYQLPGKLITFIGPIDSYGNILTTNALAVGLQLYMGGNYSLYQSAAGQELYPSYISRRFSAEYIPVNCIKTIVDDIFPDNYAGRPLIEQMVQAGKRLYILDKLMPYTADTLKTGYTLNQLEGANKNEQNIYSFFVQNELLYVTDPSIIKDYMNDAPSTQAFGQESPGFIGQFVGWQIVKKWMDDREDVTLNKLIETDPKTIFAQARYKP